MTNGIERRRECGLRAVGRRLLSWVLVAAAVTGGGLSAENAGSKANAAGSRKKTEVGPVRGGRAPQAGARRRITPVDARMEPLRIEAALAAVTGEKADVDKAVADLEKARQTDRSLTWPTLQAESVLFREIGDVDRFKQTIEKMYDYYVKHPDDKQAADLLRRNLVFGPRPPDDVDPETRKAFEAAGRDLLIRVVENHDPAWTPLYFALAERYLGVQKDAGARAKVLKRLREEARKRLQTAGKEGRNADFTREVAYLEALFVYSNGTFRRFCDVAEAYLRKYGRDERAGRLISMILSELRHRLRDRVGLNDLPPEGKRGRYWYELWKKTPVMAGGGCSKAREQSIDTLWKRYTADLKGQERPF